MKPKALPLFATWSVLFTLSAGAADWPNFRGPHNSGISEEKNLPAKWSDTENLVWKIDLPGPGSSSPVVWGDKVFVTCYTGYAVDRRDPGNQEDLRRHLLCVDRKSGKMLWDKVVPASMPETRYTGFITQHGYASSTPATDGERIYVFHGKSGVFAYDLDGKQLWKANVGTGTDGWGSAASPVLYKELVIVNAGVESGALVALNKANGDQVWKSGGIRRVWGTPTLVDIKDGKQELALSMPNKVIGLDPDTGKELWHCEGINDYICPSPVSKDRIVYAIGARAKSALAVKAGGSGDVTMSNRLWTKHVGSNVTSPSIYGDYLYWVSHDGIAHCLQAKDGEQVYQERLKGGVYASITIADGKIYVVSQKNGAFVLAAGPKFQQLAHNTLSDDSTFNGSPAVSQGRLFLRSDKRLYCIGKK
jgi:outer membrane protein assembly factor BamB